MPKLTKKAKVSAEAARISRLTNDHSAYFKMIFSHQIENKYSFSSVHNRNGQATPHNDVVNIFRAFGKFIDDSIKLSITEVENKYKRSTYSNDGTFDPETRTNVQVEHLCLFLDGADVNIPADSVRLHGYFRNNGGYFVVTRLDWFHEYGN